MIPHNGYGYVEALSARMVKFEEEEVGKDESSYPQIFKFPDPIPKEEILTVHLDEHGVHGSSLSGEVLFQIQRGRLPELLTAGLLLGLISEETGCEAGVLLQGCRELSMSHPISRKKAKRLTLKRRDCRPLLCRKINCDGLASLGEAGITPDLCHVLEPIQALKEWRTRVTRDRHEGTAIREENWLVYTKREVVSYEASSYEPLKPCGYFPEAPLWKLPAGTRRWGGSQSDVWSTCLKLPVKQLLDEHAALTLDRPIPRYQMIVDPNKFVHQTSDGPVWVPCEFDISADGSPALVGGARSHAHPHLAQHVACPVLAAALPLLAKLRRPQLLLDDRRLQVVFKAQRIIVPGNVGDKSDAEYVGLWHVDGHRENVAAVVLYYYHVDPSLRGGDMEFCGREPMDVLGSGDCSNNIRDLSSESLRQALRGGTKMNSEAVQNCRVPIGEGTLLVFSNHQMAHRVLRLKNTGSTEASRDFVALFVLDPSAPALLPARSILAGPHLLRRTLSPAKIPALAIQKVLEYLGVSHTDVMLKMQRNQLLSEQLKPSGRFASFGNLYATGNGCYTMIGWLHKLLEDGDQTAEPPLRECNLQGFQRLEALNLAPEGSDRGLSEMLSLPTAKLQERLREVASSSEEGD